MAADPARYEVHFEDETHVETNPYLGRVWPRVCLGAGRLAAGGWGWRLLVVRRGRLPAARDRLRRKQTEVSKAKTMRLPPDPSEPPFPQDPSDPV